MHIAGIARALERLGHEVVFSSPTGVDPRRTAGSSPFAGRQSAGLFHRVARSCPSCLFEFLELAYNFASFRRNRRLLRQGRFELIYERHAFFLCSTARLARQANVPLVVEVNELVGDERVRRQPLLAPVARWCDRVLFRQASLIVVVSPHLKRRIEAQGIDACKILVLPNAVDAEDCRLPADGAEVRRRWQIDRTVNIGFAGWFVSWHRLDLLLEAFARLSGREPALRLVLIGEGELGGELAATAKRLGAADKVVFTGAVSHAAMPAHIAAMDICVVPHSNEYRSPIKLFEYMAQGKAVVAPRTEPIAMVLRHGENGLMFEPGSAAGLQATLEQAVRSPELRSRLGAQARADVLARHTWTRNAEAVLKAVFG